MRLGKQDRGRGLWRSGGLVGAGPGVHDGVAFFEDWLASRRLPGLMRGQRLSLAAAGPYRSVWRAWLRFLSAQGGTVDALRGRGAGAGLRAAGAARVRLPLRSGSRGVAGRAWRDAGAVDVLAFLDSTAPKRATLAVSSPVTRRRYWRVLDRLYDHALMQGLVRINPARGVGERELPPDERMFSVVLDEAMWQALERCLPMPPQYMAERDHAVLSLVMQAGLTPVEVRSLRLHQVLGMAAAGRSVVTPGTTGAAVVLALSGRRAAQSRDVALDEGAADSLRRWLERRGRMALGRQSDWVFLSERGKALSNSRLHALVAAVVLKASEFLGREPPAHVGPIALRNSVLTRRLLQGHSAAEVARWAGLKDEKGLWRLMRL